MRLRVRNDTALNEDLCDRLCTISTFFSKQDNPIQLPNIPMAL